MKTIVICRHAKSDWNTGSSDFDRPLNKRGQGDAPLMGKLLHGYDLSPDLIISSPANRARTTAEIIAKEIGYTGEIRFEQSIYDYGAGNIFSMLQDLPEEINTVMIFGHNPTLETLVRFMLNLGGDITMPTSAMVCIESHASRWASLIPDTNALKWFLIPKLIKNLS